ncbi:universal stress protein [Nocardioides mangrovi]|uniref:Universal stress protein n=1 Tax=Nocardioides mangrovi TaxID=2874580 RepID=A0ABS7U7T7_9ACTN|nr:universal stress protein [Nocardioides mangrovi]MBZ5736950.1 universal stress protein [Nocardioides mangrovi]
MNAVHPEIVVGVAGPDDGAAAVEYAVAEARRTRAPIRLVHVVHPMLVDPMLVDPTGSTERTRHEPVHRAARELLDTVAAQVTRRDPGVPVSTSVVVGHASSALVEETAVGSTLVLQPGPGRGLHLPTYSVTRSVAARAHGPVVSVPEHRHDLGAEDERDDELGVVTVGVDDAGAAAHLVRCALEQARARGASLRVLHAWSFSDNYDDVVFQGTRMAEHSQGLAREIGQSLKAVTDEFEDVPVHVEVRHGRPADQLVAESRRSDLLVLGRHWTGRRVSHHLGSVVRTVLRFSRCPVLVTDPIDPLWATEAARG